jgi:hypothetical protein
MHKNLFWLIGVVLIIVIFPNASIDWIQRHKISGPIYTSPVYTLKYFMWKVNVRLIIICLVFLKYMWI